jgi:NADP-dependent 3-hydroxy acid dehydrogenase YdfG
LFQEIRSSAPDLHSRGATIVNGLSHKGVCLVIGAGGATGGAIARRFAREGYAACITRRSADKLQSLVTQIAA